VDIFFVGLTEAFIHSAHSLGKTAADSFYFFASSSQKAIVPWRRYNVLE
jgi:hypothetical protein